jgi:hypothetical protein
MKCQKSCGPHLGKSVHQLLGVVTFAYNLCFRHMIAQWKYLSKDYNSCKKFMMKFYDRNIPQKRRLGPQNNSRSSGPEKTAKNSKLSKLLESCFEPVGKGGWPPISTWITHYVISFTTTCQSQCPNFPCCFTRFSRFPVLFHQFSLHTPVRD